LAIQNDELHKYAVRGAEQRLLEIADEARRIFQQFPELRQHGRGFEAGARQAPTKAASAAPSTRRRRPGRRRMSAAERRAVSQRMTRYWAARRAAKKR
jgi:hypothetical protein